MYQDDTLHPSLDGYESVLFNSHQPPPAKPLLVPSKMVDKIWLTNLDDA